MPKCITVEISIIEEAEDFNVKKVIFHRMGNNTLITASRGFPTNADEQMVINHIRNKVLAACLGESPAFVIFARGKES